MLYRPGSLTALILLVLLASPSTERLGAGDWQPARGRLLSRFAGDVRPETAHREYPRPQYVRDEWQNLNGLWQFAVASEDEAPPVGRELPEEILVPFPVESALSGIMRRAERVWYRRRFDLPASWSGRRVHLHFGGVDWETTIWVNGVRAGFHRGGYDAFSFDITEFLRSSGSQELVVGVFDPTDGGQQPRGKQVSRPRGIWYTPTTGIWQTVWLEPVPLSSIGDLALIPDVDRSLLRARVSGRGIRPQHTVQLVVYDGERPVASASGRPGEHELAIPRPKLWSPSSPFLYDLDVVLLDGSVEVDRVRSYFGMRKISLGKDRDGITRLLLNGEFLFQFGPLDQGFWPDGLYTAPSDAALRYDIEVYKKLGYNMARKHVKIEPSRWYYWCDRLGLLVWQDMPSGDAHTGRGRPEIERSPRSALRFERELERLVRGFGNHPSIVMWVVFNEGWGQWQTKRLTDWVKEIDPSRLVCSASGWTDMQVGDVHDIHSYPGPAAPRPEPTRAAVLGEYGGLGLAIEGHTWQEKENWGYRSFRSKEELNDAYVHLLHRLRPLIADPGLSAAVYTQTSDVEIEVNGIMTYDRAVLKLDARRVAAEHKKLYLPPPKISVVVPTSRESGVPWRYRLTKPPEGWQTEGFDDSNWKKGPGGFGTRGTPGTAVRTEWSGEQIWIRRTFELAAPPKGAFHLRVHHDEDAEIYLNGVLAAHLRGYTATYLYTPIRRQAAESLRTGQNTIAIHCRQTAGGQYIDAGLVDVVERD